MVKPNGPRFGLSDIFMMGAVVLWGINFSFIKIALRELSPNAFNGWRVLLTAVILLALLALSGQGFRVRRKDVLVLMGLGIAGNTIYQAIFIHGVVGTSASNTSLILSTSPIFVALLGALFRIERIHWAAWLGILISFGGIYLIVAHQDGGFRFSAAGFRSDLLILCGTILWALYTVLAKPFLERMSPLKFSALTVAFGAFFYIPMTAKDMAAVPFAAISLKAWVFLALSALFGLVLGYLVWYYSVQRVGNARTAAYNNATPLFTALFAALLLGEALSPIQAVGAAIILSGVYLTRSGYRFFLKPDR